MIMSPIWASSERSMSVRTVWVDGVRHAILTADDPILSFKPRQRPQTSPGTKPKICSLKYMCREAVQRAEVLESCFRKLHMVVKKKGREVDKKRVFRRQSLPINEIETPRSLKLGLSEIIGVTATDDSRNYSDIQSNRSNEQKFMKKYEQFNYHYNDIDVAKRCVNFSDDFTDTRDNQEMNSNPLSERVLQWMDICGRVTRDGKNENLGEGSVANTQKSVVRVKGCSFRPQSSTVSQVLIQQYKLSMRELDDSKFGGHLRDDKNCIKELNDKVSREKHVWTCSLQNGKSVSSPVRRLQLKIFMPDLNSDVLEESPNASNSN